MMPDMLRMRSAGAQAVVVWTVSTGMIARLLNARASMGWDVPFVGHPAMVSGEVGQLLDKPANWEKVYILGSRAAAITIWPVARIHAGIRRPCEGQDTPGRYLAVVGRLRRGCREPGGQGGRRNRLDVIQGHHRGLEYAAKISLAWTGSYTYTPEEHNGFPTDELVMSQANSARDGAFTLAPGYA